MMYENGVGKKSNVMKEDDILDLRKRKLIIDEIRGPENQRRRDEAFKRYQCHKDQTSYYVLDQLKKQFSEATVVQMSYAISNISIVRKVVSKLARVYSNGVERKLESDDDTKSVQEIARVLNLNSQMKKTNRYLKLFKNTLFYVAPKRIGGEDKAPIYTIKPYPMAPYLYDVIENPDDREVPMVVVLSNYRIQGQTTFSTSPMTEGRSSQTAVTIVPKNDGKDQAIADHPQDAEADQDRYIWWSDKHHFTTDCEGRIINSATEDGVETGKNPIEELPFVNIAEDQDGSFWALGGDDLIDGAIHVNCMMSHNEHIGVTQGYGQLVMKGKNLPKYLNVGPNTAIKLEWDKDEDPEPSFEFVSSNPPLADLRSNVEMYLALLLTTNNLSTNGVASSLNGSGGGFPSAIAMIIDKAESMEDVNDQQQIFMDAEPRIFEKIRLWSENLKASKQLDPKLNEIPIPKSFDKLQNRFGAPKPLETDKERLEVIKSRKELKLITHVQAIMQDNPGMTEDEAKKQLLKVMAEENEKLVKQTKDAVDGIERGDGEEDEGEGNLREPKENGGADRPGAPEGDELGDAEGNPDAGGAGDN